MKKLPQRVLTTRQLGLLKWGFLTISIKSSPFKENIYTQGQYCIVLALFPVLYLDPFLPTKSEVQRGKKGARFLKRER